MNREPDPATAADFERAAAALLPGEVWDFVAGGSGSEATLAANRTALDNIFLVPRMLRDVSACTTRSPLLGRMAELPVAAAPMAYQRLIHPDGESASARAAAAAGIPFIASSLSSVPLHRITEIGGRVWFQLYWLRNQATTLDLIRRAEDAGCEAVVLTVDVPWPGRRLRDIRNRFALPAHVRRADVHTFQDFSPALSWSALARLREHTRLPLAVKGLLAPEDAVQAAQLGVDAIMVSNHGGRQLDGAVASIDVLPEVVGAVGGDCEVLLDSGIRSGTDVLRALALGASGVLLGRPLMWGLAVGGERGAMRVLKMVKAELRDAMGLAGCTDVTAARELRTVRHVQPSNPGGWTGG
ncbi:alpha-hydroxy acid oxidase [Actinoplanes sp. CA-131856]